MDRYTFAALNTYLDEERRDLLPEVDEIFVAFKGIARGRPLTVNALQHTSFGMQVSRSLFNRACQSQPSASSWDTQTHIPLIPICTSQIILLKQSLRKLRPS